MINYQDFLTRRAQLEHAGGFEPVFLPDHLFDFQTSLVEWAVRQGRAGIFADCGLGKTPMALAWAEQIHLHTGKPILFLTPLAVGFQIVDEAQKFGHDAALSRDGTVTAPITITNYEQLTKFDPATFGGVVCDESSAIKSFDGARRAEVTEFMRRIQYRLLGTATAAPNDYIELGTSSEALGQLGYMDMLTRFFVNDNRSVSSRGRGMYGSAGVDWRLKGHAAEPFWRWVSSWARAMRKPSDYGYSDNRHHLPELKVCETLVDAAQSAPGTLFDVPAYGLREEREETRRTLRERCEAAATAIDGADHAVAWCHLNDESALLAQLINGAVQVVGSDSPEAKEDKLAAFTRGEIRVLVTKPSIGAYGLNWQHCHRMTYFPSHSYEQWYQAVRRCWRFGQQHPVTVDVITTEGGSRVLANLQRKADQADAMFTALVAHMNAARTIDAHRYTNPLEMPPWLEFLDQQITDRWAVYNGDCMDMLAAVPDNSIHATIYSPPFGGLYHYSSDDRDLSNARSYTEFFTHYGYVIAEKLRVTIPGRLSAVHASVVPTSNTGKDAYTDFPGDVIRAHQTAGWLFIARHVIWKEPLGVRNRTMAKNLAHKTICEDAAFGGVAAPDELLVFRKPGADAPIAHPCGLSNGYAGNEPIPHDLLKFRGWDGDQKLNRYSHWVWRRYASSVWDDIRIDHILPFRDGRDEDDEKHVHPLQLDVIERFLDLRTLPGEKVLTPFMGVGSEVYAAVQMGRYAIGAELKPSYYQQALRNLEMVDAERNTGDAALFDFAEQ